MNQPIHIEKRQSKKQSNMRSRIKKWFSKEAKKFREKPWYSKLLDVVFVVLVLLLLIPSTRRELMTYTSKVRMYLTSVEEKEQQTKVKGQGTVVLQDSRGNQRRMSSYLDKPVFINYWATWCPPCRAEMPTLEKLYQEYGGRVNFLFVSSQPMAKQQAFLDEYDYDVPVYQLLSKPGGDFNYSVLPTSMIISRDNRVVLRKEGAVNWQSDKVRKIFDRVSGGNVPASGQSQK
jgi:thiol-disulfide isomerase/thioredoxin